MNYQATEWRASGLFILLGIREWRVRTDNSIISVFLYMFVWVQSWDGWDVSCTEKKSQAEHYTNMEGTRPDRHGKHLLAVIK